MENINLEILFAIGRIVYAVPLLFMALGHFTGVKKLTEYAKSKKVPSPKLAVMGSGLILALGSLSVLTNFHVNIGGILLVVFFLPISVVMHDFWNQNDPHTRNMERISFLKNMIILGAAITFAAM
ncbi:MAG: DoxX family membrane protein [Candidatus Paceibacterota bacterium]